MGAAIGLLAGVGLFLVWLACTVPPTSRRQREISGLTESLSRLLSRAGATRTRPRDLVASSGAAAAAVFVVMLRVSDTVVVALVFALIAAWLPVAWMIGRARRRQRELAQVWPEVVDNLVSGVRAGLSLPEALVGLAARGPELLRPAFADFAHNYQATGRFEVALDLLKADLADPVGDRVVEGLRVARAVGGGDLGRLLRNLAGHLRDDERIRSELEARQAWAVNAARLSVSAPWAVLLLMSLQSDAAAAFGTSAGVVVLAGVGVTCAVAYVVMMRIGRLPTERRVLV